MIHWNQKLVTSWDVTDVRKKRKKTCLKNQINTAKINYLFSLSSNISSKSEIDSKNNSLLSEYLTLHLQFMPA